MIAIPFVAVLALSCNFDSAIRVVAKSKLPAATARNVTAKIHYAQTMCSLGSVAPTTPQDELRIAAAMAANDAAVVRAIEIAMRSPGDGDIPARLTVAAPQAFRLIVDGITLRMSRDRATIQLMPGKHEVMVLTSDGGSAATTVTLEKGEARTLELTPEPFDIATLDQGHFTAPNIETIVTAENFPRLCLTVYRASDGQPVPMKSLHRVTVAQRGTFEATDLFTIHPKGAVCVSDAAALRDVVRDAGPFAIHIAGVSTEATRVDTEAHLAFGREVTIRGTVPESVHFVQRNGRELVPVRDGRFEITLPEGPLSLVGYRDKEHHELIHNVEFHCDGEIRLTREKVEIVQGGCTENASSVWQEPVASDLEPLQALAFGFAEGAIRPQHQWVARAETIESLSEDALQGMTGEGILQIRAYADDATLVFRTFERLDLVGGGCIPASTGFMVRVPMTARYVEIRGWTPQTSGRFKVTEFPQAE